MFNSHVVFIRLPVHLPNWAADRSMNQSKSLASRFARQKEDQGSGVSFAAYWLTRTLATFEQSVQYADVTFPTHQNAKTPKRSQHVAHVLISPSYHDRMKISDLISDLISVPVHAKNSRCLGWYRHPNRFPVHAKNSRFLGWTNWCIGWETDTGLKSDHLLYGL